MFDATPEEIEALSHVVAEIPAIQQTLLAKHAGIRRLDRGAHQQQIAGGRVVLDVANQLPPELDGLGVFVAGSHSLGIGRVSTGLGCPHLETDPDFLGVMFAFQTRNRERVDFLAINDSAAPTDTPEEFVALLAAAADAAGAEIPFGDAGELDLGNLGVGQALLFNSLRKRLGVMRASAIYLHVVRQTAKTARSSTAIQQYWTGVVEAGDTLGRFTFVPAVDVNTHRGLRPGPHYLTDDWNRRWGEGPIVFEVRWIPFLSEKETPLETMTGAWAESHAVPVGSVTFPRTDSEAPDAQLVSRLASEMGANAGHWLSARDGAARREFPTTRFAAARKLAYALSQETRSALPVAAYQSFFNTGGTITAELERELRRGDAGP